MNVLAQYVAKDKEIKKVQGMIKKMDKQSGYTS